MADHLTTGCWWPLSTVISHTLVNYDSGPFDARHGAGWDAMPVLQQW